MELQTKILPDAINDADLARTSDPLPLPAEGQIYGTLIKDSEDAKDEEVNPFKKNEKVQRTPQSSPQLARRNLNQAKEAANRTPKTVESQKNMDKLHPSGKAMPAGHSIMMRKQEALAQEKKLQEKEEEERSLAKNLMMKARKEEEDEIRKCLDRIGKMKAVTCRQKNISSEVKNGLLFLEGSLDIILSLRRSWMEVEKNLKGRVENHQDDEVHKNEENAKKRLLSSPVEQAQEKRKKETGREETPKTTEDRRRDRETDAPGRCEGVNGEPDQGIWNTVSRNRKKREVELSNGHNSSESSGSKIKTQKGGLAQKKKVLAKRIRPRLEAILIKPAEGKSYAEVLGKIRHSVRPEVSGTEIRAVRKTRNGQVLLELDPKSKGQKTFTGSLKEILGETAVIQDLRHTETIEIRELDEMTSEEEVRQAILEECKDPDGDVKIHVTKADKWAQKVAIIEMDVKTAEDLLKKGRIKIGLISGKIRRRAKVIRCYRCLGFGHLARACKGADRKNVCYKCGGTDHLRKACDRDLQCVACADQKLEGEKLKHLIGSGACPTFREALKEAKRKLAK